ncbi:MFS transporter [Candidatus Sumerlaeota bacterium]|nr:MFS transporter [Candidatus Sumerlaeota bacterium]
MNTQQFPFRKILLAIYLPSLLIAIGAGAIIPFLPLFIQELGANVGLTGLIVSMGGFGLLIFNIPGILLASRYGVYRLLFVSAAATILVALLQGFSVNLLMLAILIFLGGFAHTLWQLSRLTYLRQVIPVEKRGRAMSLMGGCMRIGAFLGALIGGYIAHYCGYRCLFFFHAGAGLIAFILLALFIMPLAHRPPEKHSSGLPGLLRVLLQERRSFATAGTCMFFLSLLRAARSFIIPLWGKHIGLDDAQIGVIFGLSSAIDMTMFIPAGIVMDRFGRRYSAFVTIAGFAIGFLAIPCAGSFGAFLAVCLFIGLSNGLGSGINMTLGVDLAPDDAPEQFIGLWRLLTLTGSAVAPNIIGLIALMLNLSASSLVTGGLGAAGAAFVYFILPETLKSKSKNVS